MTPPNDDLGRTVALPADWLDKNKPAREMLGHYLVAIAGATPGKRAEIGEAPVSIGRNAQQTLVFPDDPEMSRLHARVSLAGGTVIVEDMGSTNGTFVDDRRVAGTTMLREGNVLRVGQQLLKYERRSRSDVARSQDLERDLIKANRYVQSLLPPPLDQGAILTQWRFVPSAQLGGDAFGYYWLDQTTFVFYLIDVSGHGVGSAMHSVTVLNVLRQRALPQVDFEDPAAVLTSLNDRFSMEDHNGMFFTMWYGVYRTTTRELAYASAGHHPAYLVPSDRQASQPLGVPALMIGAIPDQRYEVQRATMPAGGAIYLFSDGVFEIVTRENERWALNDFLPLLVQPKAAGTSEAERLYQVVRRAAKDGPLDDDFSLLVVTFP
jgi:serine phosphatase RsbU (regulator of sigma subunit)